MKHLLIILFMLLSGCSTLGFGEFNVGDFCMVKEGYKAIMEQALDWAEASMFEDSGDNELLEKTVPDFHIGLIEEIENENSCNPTEGCHWQAGMGCGDDNTYNILYSLYFSKDLYKT